MESSALMKVKRKQAARPMPRPRHSLASLASLVPSFLRARCASSLAFAYGVALVGLACARSSLASLVRLGCSFGLRPRRLLSTLQCSTPIRGVWRWGLVSLPLASRRLRLRSLRSPAHYVRLPSAAWGLRLRRPRGDVGRLGILWFSRHPFVRRLAAPPLRLAPLRAAP